MIDTNRKKITNPVLEKVIYIGPDKNCIGGIASVLATYSENFSPFNYLPTNSRRGKIFGYLQLLASLSRLPIERIKGRKILHVHYGAGKSFIRKRIIMKVGRLLGFKIIGHSHSGHFAQEVKQKGTAKVRNMLRNIDSHVVLTNTWKNFFKEKLDLDASVVNNIINHNSRESRVSIDATEPLRLYYLGRLTEKKGVIDLLCALANVRNLKHDVRLIIGGDGDQREELLQKIRDLNLENIVDYRGPLNSQECQDVIAESDVMILPSYVEGLPIAILEAFEASRAVITTGVGGIPDLVKDKENGLIVTPGNISQLSEAIIYLSKNRKEIMRLGLNGKHSLTPYYPESVLMSLCELYQRLI